MRVVFLGDSHTHAIKRAIKAYSGDVKFAAYRFAKLKNGVMIGDLNDDQIVETVAELSPSDLLVSTIGGNQHSVFGMIQHPEPFDFYEPGSEETLPDGVAVIPYRVLWDIFDSGIRKGDGKRLKGLRDVAKCEVCHLAPPPPKEDDEHILNRPETAFIKDGIAERGVSPAPLRLKLWRLQCAVLAKMCDDFGVRLLMPPAEALDRGYLAPHYYADDATHANQSYGALILDQITLSRKSSASHP